MRLLRAAPLVVLLLAAAEPLAAQGARPVTLAEALALARREAPTIVQARGQVRASGAGVRAARAAYLPSLAVNASTAEQSPATARINPSTGELVSGRWATNGGLTMNLDLFDGFARPAQLRAARARESAAETGVEAEQATTGLQVKQQYFASVAAFEALGAAEAQRAQAESQLTIARAKVRAQTATRSDSLRAFAALAQAEQARLQARIDQQSADAALTRLVGSDAPLTARPDGLPAEEASGMPGLALDSAALAGLVDRSPAVRRAEQEVGAASAATRVARAPYLPTLGVSYARQALGSSNRFDLNPDPYRFSGSLRFSINLPIWNQYAREESLVRAQVAETDAEQGLRTARLTARQTFVQQYGQLALARAQIATQAAALVAAEEDLRVQQQRYQLGASTILEVLTSQTQLDQARLALVQARFVARTAKAQLEAVVGRDL